ncbi:unnamed protein product, partial [Polarella glacialis]
PRRIKYTESLCGIFWSLSVHLSCISCTHADVYFMAEANVAEAIRWFCLAVIYAQALLSMYCIACIQRCDPGAIERTAETCLPQPAEMAAWLATPVADRGMLPEKNIIDGSKSFCVRCWLWRDPVGKESTAAMAGVDRFHHCSKCQRCVEHYHHHCTYFGRCKTGTGWRNGNLRYFRILIGLSFIHPSTGLSVLTAGLLQSESWPYWTGVFLVGSVACYIVGALLLSLVACYMRPDAMAALLRKALSKETSGNDAPVSMSAIWYGKVSSQ